MRSSAKPIRVAYSFPLKLGAARICTTAWYQVDGLAAAGAEVTVFPASICRSLPPQVKVQPTMARGRFRIPNRVLSRRLYATFHDWVVSHRLEKMAGQIDVLHAWPLGSLRTLRTARRLGIPTFLERPNAHTRFAYEAVQKECDRIGVPLPSDHEHAWNDGILRREEAEYEESTFLLCPSDFVVKSYLDLKYPREKLLRHIYGYDESQFFPDSKPKQKKQGLTLISVGVCAVRKGIHFALEAWLKSPACKEGTFLIAGEFLPAYRQKLAPMLSHSSVKVLGHRNDVPELVRQSDMLVLASIEEGFGLVVTEAMASGCVPLVSDACTDLCKHMENGLVHPAGNVAALTQHITLLHENRKLLESMRAAGLRFAPEINWTAAGRKLLEVYRQAITQHGN